MGGCSKLHLDEPAEGVARLTIDNSERRGALDHELLDALANHARTLDARCLVIRGSGPVFSAGYDIGNLEGQEFEESAARLVAHPFHEALEALGMPSTPVPISKDLESTAPEPVVRRQVERAERALDARRTSSDSTRSKPQRV